MIYHTTHLGQPLVLCLLPANWGEALRIKHTLETQIEEGLSVRENRRPVYEAYRMTIKATLSPKGDEAADFTAMMGALKTELVGIPIYPDILRPSRWADRIYDAEFVVAFGRTKAEGFQVVHRSAISSLDPSAFYYWAPLLVGRFDKRPELSALTRKLGDTTITLRENSPWGYRIFPAYDEAMHAADWPSKRILANWKKSPVDFTDDILEFKAVGKGRLQAVDNQEAAIRRGQEFTSTLPSREAIRALLNFHLARKGRVGAFTMPWEFRPGADTPETPHSTRVRFADDDIELSFINGNIADTKLRVLQMPWEISPTTGEQPEQPAERHLYRFKRDVPGGPIYYRYTDYERDITRIEDGITVTYLSAQIEHDKITQGSNLDDSAAKLKSWFWTAHPWMSYVDETIEAPLGVEIFKFDPLHPDEAELRYIGDIDEVNPEGRSLAANTTVLGAMLETKVPAFFVQSLCNHDPYDEECGLREADFLCTGTLAAIINNTLTVALTNNPGARALESGWFAGGWVCVGLGERYQAREVLRSEGDIARQTLTVDRPLNGIGVGETVEFCPTCSGTCEACIKRKNLLNYGGHPHVDPDNQSLPTRETSMGGGKK
jgi:hypothetical protein